MNNYTLENYMTPPAITRPETVPIIVTAEMSYNSTVVLQVLSLLVSLFGIVANTFNIIVFIRQGAKSDSSSASLLGLAVADLTFLTTALLLSVFQALILYASPNLSWSPMDVAYLFAGIPNYMAGQITKMATAFVALQRCICVVLPFKVKSLFTSRVTLLAFILMFLLTGLGYIPLLVTVFRLGPKYDWMVNRTRLGVIGSPGNKMKVATAMYVNNVTFTLGSVATVLISTIVTVYQLNLSTKWRESVSGEASASKNEMKSEQKDDAKSSKIQKEKKLVKVIVSISVIFLVSYTPNVGYLILTNINPHARILGKNHNLAQLILGTNSVIEAMNSSINIVVYYMLSSSYKQELRLLLGLTQAKK